jgi:hypothetical protein
MTMVEPEKPFIRRRTMMTRNWTRRGWAFLPLAVVTSTAGRASATTATETPPVYQARDVIVGSAGELAGRSPGAGGLADSSGGPTAMADRPASLVGEDAGLIIRDGLLTGRLERGGYSVRITADSARGTGPLGPIDVHINRMGRGFEVAGLWNGGHLHFLVGPDEIRGTALKQISDEERGYQSCRYQIAKLDRGSGYSGLSECLGSKPLRFEVDPRSSADLTDEQTAILLVAYFAAPPAVWNP